MFNPSPHKQQLVEQFERYNSAPDFSQNRRKEKQSRNRRKQKKTRTRRISISPRGRPPTYTPSQDYYLNIPTPKRTSKSTPTSPRNKRKNKSRTPSGSSTPTSKSGTPSAVTSPRSFNKLLVNESPSTALCHLLEKKGRYTKEQITELLDRGASINYRTPDTGSTPIMIACGSVGRRGVNAEILRLMLQRSEKYKFSSLDHKRLSALHYAAKFNNCGCILELLKAGANVDVVGGNHNRTTPLHLASANSHTEAIRHLISAGANCDRVDCTGQYCLEIAITSKASDQSIDELLSHSTTQPLLQKCMDNCRLQKYRHILAKLAAKRIALFVRTAKNKTPLMYAASLGDVQLIKVLCKVPKHLLEGVNARDDNFHTALHSACCWGHADCVKVLLDNGADIQATDNNGNTPLHRAAMWNRVDVIKLLLSYGADANVKSSFNVVPLELAYSKGIECNGEPHWDSIDVLLPKTNFSKFLFPQLQDK